jgi:hypothetical protein
MTRKEAAEFAELIPVLAEIHPTHDLCARRRAAQARLRHADARGHREKPSLLDRLAADFDRVFGGE